MAAQTIKFQTNIIAKIELTAGKFYTNDHAEYGISHCWYGKSQGNDVKFFCTPVLHALVRGSGITRGGVISIKKVELDGNKKGWEVALVEAGDGGPISEGNSDFADEEVEVTVQSSAAPEHTTDQQPETAQPQNNSGNTSANASDAVVSQLIESYADAMRMWDHPVMRRILVRLELDQPSLEDIRTDAAKILIGKQHMGQRSASSPLYGFPVSEAWAKAGEVRKYSEELAEWVQSLEDDPIGEMVGAEGTMSPN